MNGRRETIACWFVAVCMLLGCGGGGSGGGSSPTPPAPAFTTADLAGTFHIMGISTGGTNEGALSGSATLSSSGMVTGGSYTQSVGQTLSLTGGQLSLDQTGVLSGSMQTNLGVTSTVMYGKLASSKTFASFVSSTNFGEYDLVTALKSGGSFGTADLTGNWHYDEISSGGTVENIYWGALQVDGSGAYTSGRSTGLMSIAVDGILSGSGIITSGGSVSIAGHMEASKEFIVFRTDYSTGEYSLSIAIKEAGPFSASDLSGIWHFTIASNVMVDGVTYGTLQMDATGHVTGGAIHWAGADIPLSGSLLAFGSQNTITGVFGANGAKIINVYDGRMNASKTIMALAGISTSGARDFIIAIKGN